MSDSKLFNQNAEPAVGEPVVDGRRRLLTGAGALAASGWMAGVAGGWLLKPEFAHAAAPIKMGIATDITGAIAPSGNANWQVAQFAVEQINKGGGIL